MKKLVRNFEQYLKECACGGGIPEEGTGMDMGLDTTGSGVKDQTDAMVMDENDEEGEENEGHLDHEEIKLKVRDSRDNFKNLLGTLKDLLDGGTSFEITVSPEGEDAEEVNFVFDGDGDDMIEDIEIEGGEAEEEGDEEGAEPEEEGSEEGGEPEEEGDDDEEEENVQSFESFFAKGKNVNETVKGGETVGGVKVPGMVGPKTGGKHVKVEEKTITQKNGSYPISGATSLKNAERAVGRSKNQAATRKHIKSAAKELGISGQLSDKFKGKK